MSHHKTDAPCDCGWLSETINDSESGIFFDADANRICLGNSTGSRYIVHCCPFCGGRFPVDEPMWVPIVPESERVRMNDLIDNLDSVDQIFSTLGPPDYDITSSSYGACDIDSKDAMRNIEYYSLSEWFNVEFYIRADGYFRKELQIKPLSPRPL
jgi:hypothetical protein